MPTSEEFLQAAEYFKKEARNITKTFLEFETRAKSLAQACLEMSSILADAGVLKEMEEAGMLEDESEAVSFDESMTPTPEDPDTAQLMADNLLITEVEEGVVHNVNVFDETQPETP